jgi:hypothetical protein
MQLDDDLKVHANHNEDGFYNRLSPEQLTVLKHTMKN